MAEAAECIIAETPERTEDRDEKVYDRGTEGLKPMAGGMTHMLDHAIATPLTRGHIQLGEVIPQNESATNSNGSMWLKGLAVSDYSIEAREASVSRETQSHPPSSSCSLVVREGEQRGKSRSPWRTRDARLGAP